MGLERHRRSHRGSNVTDVYVHKGGKVTDIYVYSGPTIEQASSTVSYKILS